ncbi:MAG: hypothetical protein H7061_08880 [Bdellovibrionaceae bacterium]|nr:hypothetical protein [Bdellovibrio sp.]
MNQLKVIFFIFLVLTTSLTARADEEAWELMLINSNKAIGQWFDSFVEGIDLFLVGKKITDRPNETSLRIENSTFSSEGKPVSNVSSVAFNPRFNNLEEYMHLKFTTYDEREEGRGVKNRFLRTTPRERNYGATVGFFRKLGNIRTAFQPRVELQNPLKISHSLTFESVAEFKTFKLNPKLELYASPVRGVGTFQSINFNFELTKIYSLTLINEGDYEERIHRYGVLNGFSIAQLITDTSSLSYSLLFSSNNRPHYHLEGYNLSVAWNEVLYKGIIDYQIIPHLDFPLANNFKGIAGITFTFNLNFR